MSASAPKHQVWPVFIIALTLMGVGFYAAHSAPGGVAPDDAGFDDSFVPTPRALPPELDTASTSHEFAVSDAAETYHLELVQEQRRGDRQVRTRLSLDVNETAPRSGDGNRRFMRTYENVDLKVGFAPETAAHVEPLVQSAVHRVTVKPTGEPISVELVSADALQLRPVLELLEQSIALTLPRLPREAVLTGEPWEWSLPATAVEGAVKGNIEATARVLGTTSEGVILQLDLDGAVVLDSNGDDGHRSASAKGTGHGLAMWDSTKRRLAWTEIRWEQQEVVGTEKIDTVSFFRRTSE